MSVITTAYGGLITKMTDRLHILVGVHDGKWVWLRTNNAFVNSISGSEAYTSRLTVNDTDAFSSYDKCGGWRYGYSDKFSIAVDGSVYTLLPSDYELGDWLPWLALSPNYAPNQIVSIIDIDSQELVLSSLLATDSYCYGVDQTLSATLLKFAVYPEESRQWIDCTPTSIVEGAGGDLLCRSVKVDGFDYPASYFDIF